MYCSKHRTVGMFWHNAAETWVDINRSAKPSLVSENLFYDFHLHFIVKMVAKLKYLFCASFIPGVRDEN